MKQNLLQSLRLRFALLVALLCSLGTGTAWAQSDYSAVYTSNVTLPSSGTNVSSCAVVIGKDSFTGTKLGKSGSGASATITAPVGTKYIHIHIAAWNGKTSTLTVKNGKTTLLDAAALTSDSGIAGSSSTFTLSTPANAPTSYYKVVTLPSALAAATAITIQANSERAVFWGVNTEVASVAISSIAFSEPKTAAVNVGETVNLTPTVLPVGYTEAVDWVSDAPGIATVNSSGVVTGVAQGTAQITAKAHNNPLTIYDVCTVTVSNVAVTGVSVKASTTIEKTKTETLTPTFTPTNATNKNVTWESDDTEVATVDEDGVVTAVAAGTANITVTTEEGGFTSTCVVTVVNEKGGSDAPFSVADIKNGATGTGKYVMGYIVGCFNSGNKSGFTTTTFNIASNLALADSPTETNVEKTIAIQLPSAPSAIRSSYNLQDNPNRAGVAKIVVCGNLESYINSTGVKSLSSAVTVAEAVKVTAAGYATWASDAALDFTGTGINAYIAAANGTKGVNFTQVYKVPANTGVLLYKDGGTGVTPVDVPVFNGAGADNVSSNIFLRGAGSAVASEDGTLHNYILNNGASGLGFYRAAGKKVAKNRAYIQIDWSEYSVKEFIALPGFDDADGINTVQGSGFKVQDSEIFNLAGQRMNKLQRGINIVNGKKVLVK